MLAGRLNARRQPRASTRYQYSTRQYRSEQAVVDSGFLLLTTTTNRYCTTTVLHQ